MKPIAALIGIALAGAAGYWLEPSIRPTLIPAPKTAGDETEAGDGAANAPTEEEPVAPQPKPEPEPEPEPAPVVPAPPPWVADLKPDQLPEKVTLKRKFEFQVDGVAEPVVVPAGVPVTPVRVEGSELVVSPFGGPIEGRVAVMESDLVERLGNQPPPVDPPPVAGGGEEEMTDPEPQPEPDPEPEPEPAPAGKLDAEAVVKLMQDSIKSGQIKEFTFEQVLGWKGGEEEERDGVTYQTGMVAYKAETIFGVKTIQAQALIKDGAIVRWIWPKSGMEIK